MCPKRLELPQESHIYEEGRQPEDAPVSQEEIPYGSYLSKYLAGEATAVTVMVGPHPDQDYLNICLVIPVRSEAHITTEDGGASHRHTSSFLFPRQPRWIILVSPLFTVISLGLPGPKF